jgi:hypothetical protein
MSKTLSNATSTSSLAASSAAAPLKFLADASAVLAPLFRVVPDAWTTCLSPRLRYDVGDSDINPDTVGGHRPHESGFDREMLRRAF